MGIMYPRSAFVKAEFSPIFGFTAIISAPDILARQSRAQKTDDSLESKNY